METAALIMGLLASGTEAEAGIIRVMVKGIDPQQGQLIVFLFQEPAGVPPSPDLIFAGSSGNSGDSTITLPFLGVPYGTYAVLAFQDTDGNGLPATDPSSGTVEPFSYSRPEPGSLPPDGFGREEGQVGNRPNMDGEAPEFQRMSFLHQGDETIVELVLSAVRPGGTGRPEGAGGRPGGRPM